MTSQIRSIYRYPIKGLSAQPVARVHLAAGQPFPFDRRYALLRPGAPVDPVQPRWAKKGLFVMLMLDAGLAEMQTRLDVPTPRFEMHRDGRPVLAADLGTAEGCDAVERAIGALVPGLAGRPRLVHSTDSHFMDKPDAVVSLINLATLRSLERRWGCVIDPLRFRANFYVDGVPPWAEFDWLGHEIHLGAARLYADRLIGRCAAVNVDPATGRRDLDIPIWLRRDFGHRDLGIYLSVRAPGAVAVGDPVAVTTARTDGAASRTVAAPLPVPGPGRYRCRGCDHVYDEAEGSTKSGLPPGTRFEAIAADWRCPDCWAEKAAFAPFVNTAV